MSFNLNKLVQPECGGANPLVAAAQQIALKQPPLNRYQQAALPPTTFIREYIQQNPLIVKQQPTATTSSQQHIPFVHNQTNLSKQQQQVHNNSQWHWNQQPINLNAHLYQQMSSNQHQQQHQQLAGTSAGDQLEIKYRNDMISQTRASTEHLPDLNYQHKSDRDDLQFWQALSQKYYGLSTDLEPKLAQDARATTSNELHDDTKVDSTTKSLSELVLGQEEDDSYNQIGGQALDRISAELDEYHFDERNPLKDHFEDPFAEGLKKLEQGDIPSAALLFEAAVQREPQNAIAWRYLGTTQAQNEKDNCAIRALRNCLKLDENDQQARLAIAVSLANETYQYEASKHLVTWLVKHERYNTLGSSLEEFHLLDRELSDDPFYINSLHNKHYNYVRDKFVDAARMSPNNPDPDVQNALGVLFNMRGEYTKAVDCFKAALSVKSNDSLLWNRLGATLANGNKSDEAVIAYRKALEISPGFLRSRYNLAISLIHLNTYDEAAKQLIQILNMQAAGKGSKNTQIRTRSITSSGIWNTLRTVATLLNKPELYSMIDGRDLARCNSEFFKTIQGSPDNNK